MMKKSEFYKGRCQKLSEKDREGKNDFFASPDMDTVLTELDVRRLNRTARDNMRRHDERCKIIAESIIPPSIFDCEYQEIIHSIYEQCHALIESLTGAHEAEVAIEDDGSRAFFSFNDDGTPYKRGVIRIAPPIEHIIDEESGLPILKPKIPSSTARSEIARVLPCGIDYYIKTLFLIDQANPRDLMDIFPDHVITYHPQIKSPKKNNLIPIEVTQSTFKDNQGKENTDTTISTLTSEDRVLLARYQNAMMALEQLWCLHHTNPSMLN